MKETEWESDYLVGVEEIDFQHRFFVELINRVAVELLATEDFNYHQRLLLELQSYASFHFISEENLMISVGYPELKKHSAIHAKLLVSMKDKSKSFRNRKISPDDFIPFLKDWFFVHTVTEDKKFGTYLNENRQPD